jgi:hypothetical protein
MSSIDDKVQKGTFTLQEQRVNLVQLIKTADEHEEYMDDVFTMY